MANIWLVKNGSEPTQGHSYRNLAFAECVAGLGLRKRDYLCSPDTTSKFGENALTIAKGPEHVVVEVDEREARAQDWKAGFYFSPVDEARSRLRDGMIASARSRIVE